jgi:hypothetical protein
VLGKHGYRAFAGEPIRAPVKGDGGGHGIGKPERRFRRDIVKLDPGISVAIVPPASSEHQRHRTGSGCRILVRRKRVKKPRLARCTDRPQRAGNPFLLRSPEQDRNQLRNVELSSGSQLIEQVAVRSARRFGDRGCGANFVGDNAGQIGQHRSHKRAFLLGQALVRVQEEIGANAGQAISARAMRGSGLLVR